MQKRRKEQGTASYSSVQKTQGLFQYETAHWSYTKAYQVEKWKYNKTHAHYKIKILFHAQPSNTLQTILFTWL